VELPDQQDLLDLKALRVLRGHQEIEDCEEMMAFPGLAH
jgi:hypothetical protein